MWGEWKETRELQGVGPHSTAHLERRSLCLLLCLVCSIWNGSSTPDELSPFEHPVEKYYNILRNAKFYWDMQGQQGD